MNLGSCSSDAAAGTAVASYAGEAYGLQWEQGKADEDRVHVVVSEEQGWVFICINDGFNDPNATDFLISNLYAAVHRELRGLLWEQQQHTPASDQPSTTTASSDHQDQCTWRRRARQSRPPRCSTDLDDEQKRRCRCKWEPSQLPTSARRAVVLPRSKSSQSDKIRASALFLFAQKDLEPFNGRVLSVSHRKNPTVLCKIQR
jgi:hypothetical protein